MSNHLITLFFNTLAETSTTLKICKTYPVELHLDQGTKPKNRTVAGSRQQTTGRQCS